jgi:hypothetical protein
MSEDHSAYAVLGLKPGADWAEIERAYKVQIKLHHPDLPGGDGRRAAEITHAYRELKRLRDESRQLALRDEDIPVRRRGYGWLWFLLSAGTIAAAVFLATGTLARLSGDPPHNRGADRISDELGSDLMDRPLSTSAIDAAVGDALRISKHHDEMALATASLDCHRKLRASPRLEQLDRCAAFDDAVVQLQNRDPLRDQGPFSELAVTGRQMNAASTLSDDSLAIDSRLDRIRLHVELALAPALPPLPPPPPDDVEGSANAEP